MLRSQREQLPGQIDRALWHPWLRVPRLIRSILELGGHPRDPKNLWPEMWGTPGTPLTSRGPFPPHLVGAKARDAVENQLHKEVCAGTLTLQEAQHIIAIDGFSTTATMS